jgi:CheY-like chemotaxis protein
VDALRVLVAEEQKGLRRMIVSLLSPEFQVIGAVEDGEQLVVASTLLRPDVIVSNIDIPLTGGFAARRALLYRGTPYPFVFVTMMVIELASGLEDGPVAYVHKTDIIHELKLAIRAVVEKGFYVSRKFRE